MAQTIDARVKQKTGTAADFAGYTLLEGEIALVRTSASGPVFNFKVGPGVFDDLDWSLQNPGAAQAVDTSFTFPTGVPGLFIPTEDGTYEGVTVDLSVGYVQLIWDGSALVKVEFPIDLYGYAKTSQVVLPDGLLDRNSSSFSTPLYQTNLFNKNTIFKGYALDNTGAAPGGIIPAAGTGVTDFIYVGQAPDIYVLRSWEGAPQAVGWFDENKDWIQHVPGGVPAAPGGPLSVRPANGRYIRLNVYNSSTIDPDVNENSLMVYAGSGLIGYKPFYYFPTDIVPDRDRRIVKPTIMYGAVSTAGYFAPTYYGKSYVFTPKLIDVSKADSVIVSTSYLNDIDYRVTYYDKSGEPIVSGSFTTLSANNTIPILHGAHYIKIVFRRNAGLDDLPLIDISLTGVFDRNFEEFNPAPQNNTLRLIIPVNVADATASDATTDNVQDVDTILPDYGLIKFPDSYTKDGAPTRLIIYCHGAGVNYSDSVTDFPATDLLPEYWLSEGYAVMDIEGNPFDNVNEHFFMPQAIQSYVAAYDWVVTNFNIKRDGVFLGGRSMGGGMVFEILQSRIPVIAACPLVPGCTTLFYWNYMNASRRAFVAQHLGFTGDVTWTSSNPMTVDEWQHLQDNFDKLVKYSPLWRGIESLPSMTTLFEHARISSNTAYDADERSTYENLHFRVKSPIKIFSVMDDATVPWQMNAEIMYRMLINAGMICELRMFEEGGHHFEIDNPDVRTDFTNSRGVLIEDVPVPYIEMLRFWRRYENA